MAHAFEKHKISRHIGCTWHKSEKNWALWTSFAFPSLGRIVTRQKGVSSLAEASVWPTIQTIV
ncbi:MAG: hypothetical protein K6G15_06485 [Desulfovibrio sp.]|nr:hypothetical protein [Desulfovibrio sp.]